MSRKRKEHEIEQDESDGDFDEREFASLDEYKDILAKNKSALVAQKNFVNNAAGLKAKREEIALPSEWPWIEKLEVVPKERIVIENEEDDLKREAAFYAAALGAVKTALIQLDQSGVPYKRPLDFYAETVKPDSHMAKVKQVLLNEQKRKEDVEARKKQAEIKKFAKAAHAEKVKERSKQKRDALDEIDRFKHDPKRRHNESSSAAFKKAIRSGGAGGRDGDNVPAGGPGAKRHRSDEHDGSSRKGGKNAGDGLPKKSRKREGKDARYGNGGKKKYAKANTKESAADDTGFSIRRNKAEFGATGKSKPYRDSKKGSFKKGGRGGKGSFKR